MKAKQIIVLLFITYMANIVTCAQSIDSLQKKNINHNNKIIISDTIINNTKYKGNIIIDINKNSHSPKKAGIFSAIIPGLGQGYNKKYWKIPLIWAGFATTGYFIYSNIKPMNKAYNAYIWIDNGSIGEPPNDFITKYGNSLYKLESVYNQYRYRIEIFSVISVTWYMLNIIDAIVDAHLMDFDVSDNLSLSIQPEITPLSPQNNINNYYTNYYTGLSVKINF